MKLQITSLAEHFKTNGSIYNTLVQLDKVLQAIELPDVEGIAISRIIKNGAVSVTATGSVTIAEGDQRLRISESDLLEFSPDGGESWAALQTKSAIDTLTTVVTAHIANDSIHGAGGSSTPAQKSFMRNTLTTPPNNWIAGNDFSNPNQDATVFTELQFTIVGLFASGRWGVEESFLQRIAPNDNDRLLFDFGRTASDQLFVKIYNGSAEVSCISQYAVNFPIGLPVEVGVMYEAASGRIVFFYDGITESAQHIGENYPFEAPFERWFIGRGFCGDFFAMAMSPGNLYAPGEKHAPYNGGLTQYPHASIVWQADHVPTNPANLQDIIALIRGTTPAYHLYRVADQEIAYTWRL